MEYNPHQQAKHCHHREEKNMEYTKQKVLECYHELPGKTAESDRIRSHMLVYIPVMLLYLVFIVSCKRNPLSPGLEYMPDMYRQNSVRAYEGVNGEPAMRHLPPGVIPQNEYVYNIPNTPEGYQMAAHIKNPLPATDSIIQMGKFYYERFCTPCHGASGQGDGKVVTIGGFPPPPSYTSPNLMNLPEGQMFHSITYGKNLMPSHAYQLTPYQRWMVIHYIKKVLQDTTKKS